MSELQTERMRRADALLDAWSELPSDLQRQRLEALHLDDPRLAALVADLLVAWNSQESAVGQTGAAARHLARNTPLEAGTRIGAYVVDELLGHGGMGEVYAAHRGDGQFEQRVAIKRILDTPLLNEERAATHLSRERALLARLSHPGVVTLLDGGVDSDGHPWLAMEHIEGHRLDHYLQTIRPDFAERFELLLQLIDAVAYAHRQLIVHGDLKPANIMVQQDGRLRVLDFGIARSLQDELGRPEIGMATPGWASPEQIARGVPGIASDQYQIGLLLETLLTNSQGNAKSGASLRVLAEERKLAFSARLDGQLDRIALRCLQEQPDSRYPDLGALKADLVAWRDYYPISQMPQTRRYRLHCFFRRNPMGSALAAGLFSVLLVGALLLWHQNVELRDANAAARESALQAQNETVRQDQVLGFLEATLTAADPRGSAGALNSIDALLDVATEGVATEFQEDPSLRAEVRAMLVFIALRREQRARAEALLRAAENDVSLGLRPRAAASLMLARGDLAFYSGDARGAETLYREALAGMDGDSLRQANWRIYLRNQLINTMRLHGREDEARSLIPALLIDLDRYPVRAENKAASYTFMALIERDTGRALELHRRSYEALANHLGPNEPTVIRRLANVAGATLADGDASSALEGYAEAMRRVAARGELESEYFITPQSVFGRLLAAHGRWDEAQVWLDRAERLQAAARGTSSPLYLYVRGDLLQWQIEREPSEALLVELRQWRELCQEQIGEHHARSQFAARLEIQLLRRLGRNDEALTLWQTMMREPWAISSEQAAVETQWQIDGAALMLDLGDTEQGCLAIGNARVSSLLGPPLIEGLAAALDRAYCESLHGTSNSIDYAEARKALQSIAGAEHWRVKRRPLIAEPRRFFD